MYTRAQGATPLLQTKAAAGRKFLPTSGDTEICAVPVMN